MKQKNGKKILMKKKLKTKKNKCRYYFRQFEAIWSFGDSIYTSYRWGWEGAKQSIRKYGRI